MSIRSVNKLSRLSFLLCCTFSLFLRKKSPARTAFGTCRGRYVLFCSRFCSAFCQPSHTKFLSSFRKSTLYSSMILFIPFWSNILVTVSVW